ncbi:unnamed protein product [Ascophyllum nodosum]
MPLPGFKMANELKVAESVTTMTNNGVGEARPKLARKQPSRCKKDDADQGSSPSSGKRPTCCGGDDEDNKKARAGTQSSPGKNNNNKGSRRDDAVVRDGNTIISSAVDAAAGGLDHITVGGNGGRDMYKNKNESASADRERAPVEAGRSSPVSTRTEDSGVHASCPVSNDSAIVDRGSIIISSSVCTGTRDKPTTGLLRSLMIGPTQDRRSTMELYRQTLSSSSPVSSSSSTLQSSRRKAQRNQPEDGGGEDTHNQGRPRARGMSPPDTTTADAPNSDQDASSGSDRVTTAPSIRSKLPSAAAVAAAAAIFPSDQGDGNSEVPCDHADGAERRAGEGPTAERSGERWQPARSPGGSGGLKEGTSDEGRRRENSGSADVDGGGRTETFVRNCAPFPAPLDGRRGAWTRTIGTTQEGGFLGQSSFGEEDEEWRRLQSSTGSRAPGLPEGGSTGLVRTVTEEPWQEGAFGREDEKGREQSDHLPGGGNCGSTMGTTGTAEGNYVEHHLVRQFQGWDGHRKRQLNMRQEEHQFTRWQQQQLQQQRLLEKQLDMLRTSHLQLRRDQQRSGSLGSGLRDSRGECSEPTVPSYRPPTLSSRAPTSLEKQQQQLVQRHQLVDGGRDVPSDVAACLPHSEESHSVYLSVPPDGCDNRALAMPTPPGPDSRLDRLPSPGRSRLPFFPDPQAQEHCQQQEQHHVCVEHSHPHPQRYHPTPSFAFSQTASLGYPSPLQEAGQPFLPSQNLHTQWPREEVGGMPHPASVGPKAVNDRSCAGAGDFRGGTQDGNCSGGVGDHTDTTLAMRPIKLDRSVTTLDGVYAKAGEEGAHNRQVVQVLKNEMDATRSELVMARTASSDPNADTANAAPENPIVYLDGTSPSSTAGSTPKFTAARQTEETRVSLGRSVGRAGVVHPSPVPFTEASRVDSMPIGAMDPQPPIVTSVEAPAATETMETSTGFLGEGKTAAEEGDEAVIESRDHIAQEGRGLSKRPRRASPTPVGSGNGNGNCREDRQEAAPPEPLTARSTIAAVVSARDTVPLADQPPSVPALQAPGGERPGYVRDCISSGSSSDTTDLAESTPPARAIPGSPAATAAHSPIVPTASSSVDVVSLALDAPPSERPPGGRVGAKGRRRPRGRFSWGDGAGLELIVEASTKLSELESGYNRQQENARALDLERRRSRDLEACLEGARSSLRDRDIALKDRDLTITRLSVEVAQNTDRAEAMRGQLASLKAAIQCMEEQLEAKDTENKRLANEIAQQRHSAHIPSVRSAASPAFSFGLCGGGGGGTAASVAPGGALPRDILSFGSTQHHPQDYPSRQQQPPLQLPPPLLNLPLAPPRQVQHPHPYHHQHSHPHHQLQHDREYQHQQQQGYRF